MCIRDSTTTDYEDLNKRFGKEVADTVAALTKNMALPEAEREKVYDAGLAKASWQARLVKLADAYDNLHDVETFTPERRAEQRKKAIERCKRAVSIALAGGMGSKDPSRKVIEDAAEIVRRIYAR